MKYKFLIISIILALFHAILINVHAQIPEKGDKIALFCLTKQINEGIDFNNPLIPILENSLIDKGFNVYTSPVTPLISKQMLQYTLVENIELKGKETKTGRLYFELGCDGLAKIESENGLAVYSKIEISSVEWILDKEKSWKLLDGKGCNYALFVTAISEEITETLNKKQLSGQKSVRSSIIMSLIKLKGKSTVKSFYDEIPSMDSSRMQAAVKGWNFLVNKAISQWFLE